MLSAYGKFDVRDFGAKGDGVAKDTTAIQSAIDRCGESGGGRVVLANGTFLSGSIRLRTGVELHIDGTARLLASPDIADFPEWKDVRHVKSENRLAVTKRLPRRVLLPLHNRLPASSTIMMWPCG